MKRCELGAHENICAYALLAPRLLAQEARITQLEDFIQRMQRFVPILEELAVDRERLKSLMDKVDIQVITY